MFLLNKLTNKLSPNKKKVALNLYWATIGKVVNMLGALFVGILVARYLGPEQYGLMNYIISYVAIFSILSNFGLDNIEIRELAKNIDDKDKVNSILGTCLRIRLLFAFIAFILVCITVYMFETSMSTSILIMVYASSMFVTIFNVIRNYFTSIVQNEYVVKTEISRTLIGAVIKIVLLWFKAPLSLFIVASLFDFYLVAGGYIVSYHEKVGKLKKWKYDRSIVPFMLKESFPLLLSGAAVIIYQRIDQVMIKNMIDAKSVGYFATAGKFVGLILFIPTVIAQTITPLLVRAKENNIEDYKIKRQQFVSVMVWLSIVISVIVSVLSYWLLLYTYGVKYLPAVPVLQIMAFKTVGMALSSSAGQLIIIDRIQKWAVIRNIIGCIVCIGFNYILIPHYGIIGSAWVTIISVIFAGFLSNLLIPPYWYIFKIEVRAIFFGWKEFINIIKLLIRSGLKLE